MDEMTVTTINLATCAQNGREGVAKMRAAEGRWVDGALETAQALHTARLEFKNDAAFGAWCDGNGLGLKVIDKDTRAALIRIGHDLPFWRTRLDMAKGRSLRQIVKHAPPEVSQVAIPARHQTKPGRKAAPAPAAPKITAQPDPVQKAADRAEIATLKKEIAALKAQPVAKAVAAAKPVAPDEVQKLKDELRKTKVMLSERSASLQKAQAKTDFPTAPEIAEAFGINEVDASKGLATMVKARTASSRYRLKVQDLNWRSYPPKNAALDEVVKVAAKGINSATTTYKGQGYALARIMVELKIRTTQHLWDIIPHLERLDPNSYGKSFEIALK